MSYPDGYFGPMIGEDEPQNEVEERKSAKIILLLCAAGLCVLIGTGAIR